MDSHVESLLSFSSEKVFPEIIWDRICTFLAFWELIKFSFFFNKKRGDYIIHRVLFRRYAQAQSVDCYTGHLANLYPEAWSYWLTNLFPQVVSSLSKAISFHSLLTMDPPCEIEISSPSRILTGNLLSAWIFIRDAITNLSSSDESITTKCFECLSFMNDEQIIYSQQTICIPKEEKEHQELKRDTTIVLDFLLKDFHKSKTQEVLSSFQQNMVNRGVDVLFRFEPNKTTDQKSETFKQLSSCEALYLSMFSHSEKFLLSVKLRIRERSDTSLILEMNIPLIYPSRLWECIPGTFNFSYVRNKRKFVRSERPKRPKRPERSVL